MERASERWQAGPEMERASERWQAGIDVDRAIHLVERLAAAPRPSDSDAAYAAVATIEGELARIGVSAEESAIGEVDLPAITILGTTLRVERHVATTNPDVLVRFGPPGKALLVMAHYDTVQGSPGAVDNAAAVGLLVELARVLYDHPPAQPVMLAFTANEEGGLVGAEALAERRGGEIEFAIALDMIGGSGRLALNGASKLIGDAEMEWLADAADRAGIAVSAPLPHRVISRWWPQAERSDHGAFTRRGIRAVHFYNRGQDGEWIDLAYHSPRDVIARVDRASVDAAGRLLRTLVLARPPVHASDGFWLPLATNVVVPRWTLLVFEVALIVIALGALVRSRVRSLHLGHDRIRERGPGLWAGAACGAVAAGVTYGIERLSSGDHPAPWLHAPLYTVIAESLVFAGLFGLATRAVGRFARWQGERRYLAVAIVLPLTIGIAFVAIGAAELAWIWLVPAAVIALMPRVGRFASLGIGAALLPAVLVLAPNQLREAAWNGFLPARVPLTVWIVTFEICAVATTAWCQRRRATGPLGTLLLTVGCGLAVVSGLMMLVRAHPACSAANFNESGLACEAARGVR
jgi:hypothetical protein